MKRHEIQPNAYCKTGSKVTKITAIDGDMVEFIIVENPQSKPSVGTKHKVKLNSLQSNYQLVREQPC